MTTFVCKNNVLYAIRRDNLMRNGHIVVVIIIHIIHVSQNFSSRSRLEQVKNEGLFEGLSGLSPTSPQF